MNRSLQDYALVAEVVGAVAVVISLIYVGISVNQHTDAVQVANHQALVAMDQETTGWFKDPDFVATYLTASEDFERLSAVQRSQVSSYMAEKFNAWEYAYLTRENGMMADNIWQGWDGHYRTLLKQPGGRRFWHQERMSFSPVFRVFVDSIAADLDNEAIH